MSKVLVVQVGQCGNQLGETLFEDIYKSGAANSNDTCHTRFFSTTEHGGELIANALLVDMESKVVAKCLRKQRVWSYNPRACVSAKQGSGNNWANGYNNYGNSMEETIRDALRVLSGQIASISTVLLLMSAAGGTGSGLGCKITEIVRDMIPGALLINQVVLPFSQGEVAVQGYNTILTLASLYQHSDSISLSHNDHYQALARRLLPAKACISFSEINNLISSHTAGVILPSYRMEGHKDHLIELDQIVESLVPHPAYKLLSTRNMPVVSEDSRAFTNTSWEMLGKYSRQMLLQNSVMDEGLLWSIKPRSELNTRNKKVSLNTCISNVVICRGSATPLPEVEEKFNVADMYRAERTRAMFGYSRDAVGSIDKSLFVMSNAAKNAQFLEKVLAESWRKLQAKAFLYQYENFGLGRDWFLDSFNVIEKINLDYSELIVL